MAHVSPASFDPSQRYAQELFEALITEARDDADRVADFLEKFDPADSASSPMPLGQDLALFLGVFLRLAHWEYSGLEAHLEAGLPLARQAFAEAHQSVVETGRIASARDLWTSVWRLFIERFAWHGSCELDAAITLDSFDEDTAVDILAQLLWAQRNAERGGNA